ncbi:hypothetical protein BZARG_3057 [Bizionia argentinensis JUB59]|uniref:Uncharacterized protein n=1 Tax=Bizionia argentinensis JUB59 TaxID=1046627 RepID=G2EGG0_9FLAO|nr:hypothetical protein [Bizionia argentinensis]EGV42471.2 hypothetical protein BZARG_3057 [Bizionia argentinensis JUB59]
MKNLFLLSAIICMSSAMGQSKIPSAESQIKTTLMACPEMYQETAKILGYNQEGELITLREGKSEVVCLADNPNKDGISTSCYSDKLEPYMARGRELLAEGKSELEKREIRKNEIDAGTLFMPKLPAAVYVLTAAQKDLDFDSGELQNSKIRYVLYKPYMTTLETGLPSQPGLPGMPWLMDADTHRSHIMITPPAEKK